MSRIVQTDLLHYLPLLALLLWAATVDVRARRIPNWLTLTLALSGLTLSFMPPGALSPTQSALGFAAGFGIGLVLFMVGAWGAGDAKLLAGIGAWMGAASVVWVTAGAAIVGMIAALIYSVAQGRVGSLLRGGALLGMELSSGWRASINLPQSESAQQIKARTLPLAVPILLATAVLLFINILRGS